MSSKKDTAIQRTARRGEPIKIIGAVHDNAERTPAIETAREVVEDSLREIAARIGDEAVDDAFVVASARRRAIEDSFRIDYQTRRRVTVRKCREAMQSLLRWGGRGQPA